MTRVALFLWLFASAGQQADNRTADANSIFERGTTFTRFLAEATSQRELWLKNAADTDVPPELIARAKRVAPGLRLLIIAEDWCADSVHTVPYVAALAAAAGIDLHLVNRTVGAPAIQNHRTPDGRTATPTIVLLLDGRDVGAWVERPAILQQAFATMSTDSAALRLFTNRQAWYETDRGRATLEELLALAERAAR